VEWLWIDVLAMPEVCEDMSEAGKEKTEEVRSVVLKIVDPALDLDELPDLLFETVNNEAHRYSPLLYRLSHLRPASKENTGFIRSALREDDRNPLLLAKMYHGCGNRYTDVEVDQARAFYPFLDLQWIGGWSLKDGLSHIQESFPKQRDILEAYCNYGSLQSLLPLKDRKMVRTGVRPTICITTATS
jgi:hypothetical protein